MLRSSVVAAVLTLFVVGAPGSAHGQQVSPLATCLADSTTGKDRKDLAEWVFFAIAAHPRMKPYTTADAEASAEASSRAMATLVVRLLTESCVKEARAASKDGEAAKNMQIAFEWLGKVAMQELMTDKAVQDAMGGFGRYVDMTRLNKVLSGK